MIEIEIIKGSNTFDYSKISPVFIYNRIDLFNPQHDIVCAHYEEREYCFEIMYEHDTAILGVWLMDIPVNVFCKCIDYIFSKRKQVKKIIYEYGKNKMGYSYQKNHFRIELPNSIDALKSRLSSKGRYNIRREFRLLKEDFNGCMFINGSYLDIPEEIIEKYLQLKKITHGKDYKMTAREYVKKYHVTDIYYLKLGNGDIPAILLSCEQCKTVYIENLTYDLNYSKYSPGQVLYDLYLCELISKGFKEIYLAGGNLEYKRRYGSIEDISYNAVIYRNKFLEFCYVVRQYFRKMVKTNIFFLNKEKKTI